MKNVGALEEQEERQATRNRVARSILSEGPRTTAELASSLGLTPAGVRRHIDALLAEGLVEAREQRVYGHRGRGRPAKVFALTDSGRAVFHHDYDVLAVDALRFIAESGEEQAGRRSLRLPARRRFADLAARYQTVLAEADPSERAGLLAEALTADGYAASTREAEKLPGEQLCQHHCPVQHVAEQFPQLCEVETQVFAELLGTHVQRLATIAHGDGVCTTFIPPSAVARQRAQAPEPIQSEGDASA